jgi:hypothetical protein
MEKMAASEVKLLVYDLSHGMARSLSAQFLGGPEHAIDIIPHTSLLVYGKEYYFGGGIQCCEPHEFRASRQLSPIEVIALGSTTTPRAQFDDWCASAGASDFAPHMYDLLSNNCNNFSHTAATRGLSLSRGVPQWIMNVPSKFLASPMGMMIRPILEGMQVSGPGATAGGHTFDARGAPGPVGRSMQPPNAAPAANNPWAGAVALTPTVVLTKKVETPFLDGHSKPLLSSDTSTINICVSKLTSSGGHGEVKEALEKLAGVLQQPDVTIAHDVLDHSSRYLLECLDSTGKETTCITFSLMLLRLVLLHAPADDDARVILAKINGTLGSVLLEEKHECSANRMSHAARAMAWCAVSNAAGTAAGLAFLREDAALESALVDAAVFDSSPDKKIGVRQSALAFLYNVAHGMSLSSKSVGGEDEITDMTVSLLCGMLDGIIDENDDTARFRKLLVVGKILKVGTNTVNESAKQLVKDLEFVDAIVSLRDTDPSSGIGHKVKDLAEDICTLLC